jgi:hypothetical protein
VPINNACFFNTSTNFSCVKMWGPGSAHYFIAPLPRVTRVYRYQCPGQICFLHITAWFFKHFKFRQVSKKKPMVIWLIQIVFVDQGLYIINGYLIFPGIVIMNLKNCHDTQSSFHSWTLDLFYRFFICKIVLKVHWHWVKWANRKHLDVKQESWQ